MNARSTQRTTAKPMPEPEGGWPRDNYTGHFGYFNRDPFTGKREPADEETRKAMEVKGITSADGEIGEPQPAADAPVAPVASAPPPPAGGDPAP